MTTLHKLYLFWSLSIAACACVAAPKGIRLTWDYADADRTNITSFVLRSSPLLSVPMTNWTVAAVVPASATNIVLSMEPQQTFFYLTASNWWGESDPSNVANTPPKPGKGNNLTISQ